MNSYPYASGVFSSLETKILSSNKIIKLAGLNEHDFIKSLHDAGYNSSIDDFKSLMISEELKLKKLIMDNTPNECLSNLLFLTHDAEHLKIIYKCQLFNLPLVAMSNNGSIDLDDIMKVYNHDEFNNKYLKNIINDINSNIKNNISAKELSFIIDNAVLKNAIAVSKNKAEVLEKYLKSYVDYINILTFWRFQNLKWDEETFVKYFIQGGNYHFEVFKKAYGKSIDEIIPIFKPVDGINNLLKEFYQKNDLTYLELKINQSLINIAKEYRHDAFGFGPVLYYYLAKDAEIKNIRKVYSSSNIDVTDLLNY